MELVLIFVLGCPVASLIAAIMVWFISGIVDAFKGLKSENKVKRIIAAVCVFAIVFVFSAFIISGLVT